MQESTNPSSSGDVDRDVRRRRMLNYGFAASIIGLAVGILLDMPVVWGLSIAGIVICGIKRHRALASDRDEF